MRLRYGELRKFSIGNWAQAYVLKKVELTIDNLKHFNGG